MELSPYPGLTDGAILGIWRQGRGLSQALSAQAVSESANTWARRERDELPVPGSYWLALEALDRRRLVEAQRDNLPPPSWSIVTLVERKTGRARGKVEVDSRGSSPAFYLPVAIVERSADNLQRESLPASSTFRDAVLAVLKFINGRVRARPKSKEGQGMVSYVAIEDLPGATRDISGGVVARVTRELGDKILLTAKDYSQVDHQKVRIFNLWRKVEFLQPADLSPDDFRTLYPAEARLSDGEIHRRLEEAQRRLVGEC